MTTTASNGKAATIKKIFSRETAVSIDIQADKSIIWALLRTPTITLDGIQPWFLLKEILQKEKK